MSQKEVGYSRGQPLDRFHNSYKVNPETDCWEWQNNLHQKGGYGRCYYEGKNYRAHVLSFILHIGSITQNNIIRHTCDNTCCINPNHLIQGTQVDNMLDKKIRNRAKGINKGVKNPNAKLTDNEVSQIHDLIDCGLFSQKFIALKYNVDQSHISRIKNYEKRPKAHIGEIF